MMNSILEANPHMFGLIIKMILIVIWLYVTDSLGRISLKFLHGQYMSTTFYLILYTLIFVSLMYVNIRYIFPFILLKL